MPGRHVDDKPLTLTTCNSLERICHLGMMPATNEARPHLLNEGKEPVLRHLLIFKLLQLLKLSK
jgi:hypothetical protein